MQPARESANPLQAVFAPGAPIAGNPGRRRMIGWTIALAAHGALWVLAIRSEPSLEAWSTRIALLVHDDLTRTTVAQIDTPTPAPPPPPPQEDPQPPPPATRPPPRARVERVEQPRPQQPAVPAQAAAILVREPSGPIDLTAQTFVSGQASSYVGGATAADGTNTRAPVPGPPSAHANVTHPVSLPTDQWRCPWPAQAMIEDIYEQSVTLRVLVRADGSVVSATLIQDPGYGFGAAAVACAKRTHFVPARDGNGQSITAQSPPIRVRFTR